MIWHNVVERLFMVGGGRGWGVGQIQRSLAPRDYSAISSFLSANGPLLSAANKLLADPYIRFRVRNGIFRTFRNDLRKREGREIL